MLIRNLSIKHGLCNGTRLIIQGMKKYVLQAEIVSRAYKCTVHFIPRISLTTKNNTSISIGFKRHQFPIKLAYAMHRKKIKLVTTLNRFRSQVEVGTNLGLRLSQPQIKFMQGEILLYYPYRYLHFKSLLILSCGFIQT